MRASIVTRVLLAVALLGAAGFSSAVFEVSVKPELNGLDVGIETVERSNGIIVKLTNNSPQRVRCELRFDAPPQTPGRRTASIDPGATRQVTHRAARRWFRVEVAVTCEPAPRN
jgi:hypothetical protein